MHLAEAVKSGAPFNYYREGDWLAAATWPQMVRSLGARDFEIENRERDCGVTFAREPSGQGMMPAYAAGFAEGWGGTMKIVLAEVKTPLFGRV
jgi:hypothetical protein